jgi:hypothetical protein
MKRYFVFTLLALATLGNCTRPSSSTKEKEAAPGVSEKPLTGAEKISEWKQASESQKMGYAEKYLTEANKNTAGKKIEPSELSDCLDEAIRSSANGNELSISEVASACIGMLHQLEAGK